jgi:hypothetical protein
MSTIWKSKIALEGMKGKAIDRVSAVLLQILSLEFLLIVHNMDMSREE